MKEFFKNTTASFLAVLVLLSTMSFTINYHYCGDVLVDSSIITKAKSCGMDMHNTDEDIYILEKSCCQNEVISIEGQDNLILDYNSFNFNQQLFITSFVYTFISLFESVNTKTTPFNSYIPPLIVKDIQILDAVFLI